MMRRERPPWAVGMEAKPCLEIRAEEVPLLMRDSEAGSIATIAAPNKCLAKSNKSHRTGNDKSQRFMTPDRAIQMTVPITRLLLFGEYLREHVTRPSDPTNADDASQSRVFVACDLFSQGIYSLTA